MQKSRCRQCAAFVELKFLDLSAGVLNLEKDVFNHRIL